MDEPTDDNERISVGGRVSIFPRGKKRIWTAEFHGPAGHSRKSLGTSNKKVALDRVTEIAAQLANGVYQEPTKNTLIEQASQDYLAYLMTNCRAKRTITRYRGELKTFTAYAEDHRITKMSQVTMLLMDSYRTWRSLDHDPASVYHETIVIKQLFKWAKRRGLFGGAQNLIADYECNKPRPKDKAYPTLEQVNAILVQCTPRRKVEIGTAAFTGMRVGEVQGLNRVKVNLQDGWLDIVDQVTGPTKTTGSVRSVPIHPRLLALLKMVPKHEHELFFSSEPSKKYPGGGRPINTKKLNEYFKAAAARAGIQENFTFHSLRHFFKTICINSGVPREMVDRWQGHSDGSVSGRYYHVNDLESKKFMNSVPFSVEGDDNDGQKQGDVHESTTIEFGSGLRLHTKRACG